MRKHLHLGCTPTATAKQVIFRSQPRYLRSQLLNGATNEQLAESLLEFDDSWTHSLDTAALLYYLDSFEPIRGEGTRSRTAAWIQGKVIPLDVDPTDIDVYEQIIQQIDDDTVYTSLNDEL